MTLALFDLDNTLLAGDSDHSWGVYLGELGVLDTNRQRAAQDKYFQDYQNGCLDIDEFLRFQLRPLKENSMADLLDWRARFMREKVHPMIGPAARDLVERHRNKGHEIVIITATNSFVTGPIAEEFGPHVLIATEPEQTADGFTGRVRGTPCFREGKVTRLREWLQRVDHGLEGSWFYSDSHNDIPLLNLVSNPIAVNPDSALAQHARQHNWPVIHLY